MARARAPTVGLDTVGPAKAPTIRTVRFNLVASLTPLRYISPDHPGQTGTRLAHPERVAVMLEADVCNGDA